LLELRGGNLGPGNIFVATTLWVIPEFLQRIFLKCIWSAQEIKLKI
jgi:hypothetical protein